MVFIDKNLNMIDDMECPFCEMEKKKQFKYTIFDIINLVMIGIKEDLQEMNYFAMLVFQLFTFPIAIIVCICIGISDFIKERENSK